MRKLRALRASNGFSLVEVLVASFFMLVMLLGILPMFHRSTVSNQMAYDNTRAAAFARSEIENYVQAPFDDPGAAPVPVMNVPSGESELEIDQYFDPIDHVWKDAPVPDGVEVQWFKKVTVRQFHISAIDTGVLDDATPLGGGAHAGNVHLKQVLIEIRRGEQSSILGPPRTITLNTFRSN